MAQSDNHRRTPDGYAGCLLAGAVGDALGGPTEFMKMAEIRRRWGPQGQTGYVAYNRLGQAEFTDDTQMTLFTAEGLLRGLQKPGPDGQPDFVPAIWQAYQRWLKTQEEPRSSNLPEDGLLAHPELWKTQAPGMTCLSALRSGRPGSTGQAVNNSKGCGGVMRVAPVGLLLRGRQAFELAAQAAALTHGHPSGYLPAGVLAQAVAGLADGLSLETAFHNALETLRSWPGHHETLAAVQRAMQLAASMAPAEPETVESLGGGWVGEEALAISVYCALKGAATGSLRAGILLAVNHSGDNDSTGSITGNLLGLLMGRSAIPEEWLAPLEMKREIEATALQLLSAA